MKVLKCCSPAVVVLLLTLFVLSPVTAQEDVLPGPGKLGDVRICLTDDPLKETVISTVSTARLLTHDRRKNLRSFPEKTAISVRLVKGIWQIDGKPVKETVLELVPANSPALWVNDRCYRGFVRLVPFNADSFWVVNVLPLEHYLCSVIDGEIPGTFENEARKAQTVAARTYTLRRRQANQARHCDLYASPVRDQNYHGYQYRNAQGRVWAGESARSRRAVRETLGLVLMRQNELSRSYYSACCGGITTAGASTFPDAREIPSVPCEHCHECPRFRWTSKLTDAEMNAALKKAAGKSAPATVTARSATVDGVEDRTRIPTLNVVDANGKTISVDSKAFRSAVPGSVNSPWFTVQKDGANWTIEGKGHGHGVGLCQWGANGFAKDGHDFRKILTHYYPGVSVVRFNN